MTAVESLGPEKWGATPIPVRVAERAATRYTVDPSSGCHVSTYAAHIRTGYAKIGWGSPEGGHHTYAHRAAWVHYTGEQLSSGETVDHRQAEGCTSRACVKREHLRLLTHAQNSARHQGQDWPLDGTCVHGHGPEDRETVYGRTRCGRCFRIANAASMRRRRARERAEKAKGEAMTA